MFIFPAEIITGEGGWSLVLEPLEVLIHEHPPSLTHSCDMCHLQHITPSWHGIVIKTQLLCILVLSVATIYWAKLIEWDNILVFPFGKLEPIILLVLPIIPSRVSQNFHSLFLIYSHAITYYSYSDCLCKTLHVGMQILAFFKILKFHKSVTV